MAKVEQPANTFESYVRSGNEAMDAQRFPDAVKAFDQALRIRFDPDVATDRGICLHRQGRSVEALADFEYVTMARPDHWQARYNRAALLVEQGRLDEAKKDLEILKQQKAPRAEIDALESAIVSPHR